MNNQRYSSIDIFRGFSIALVINSHLFFGLYGGVSSVANSFDDPIRLWFSFFASIGQLFFFTSGCSLSISIHKDSGIANADKIIMKNVRRGIIIIVIGILFDPLIYFHFGHVDTLQAVGLASIVIPIVYFKCSTEKTRSRNLLLAGIIVVAMSPLMRCLVGYPIIDPAAEPLVYYRSPEGIIEYVQAWLTTSFFPVFLYLAFFLFGAWFGERLLAAERSNTVRKNNRAMIIKGIVLVIAGIIAFILPYSFIETELDVPQWEQSWWVIELSFNIQPMTTCSALLYLGFSITCMSTIHEVFDRQHSMLTNIRLGRWYRKSHLSPLLNTFVRYSYLSFTIYILQYLWIPVLRVLQLLTGIKMLYSIDDDEIILVMICIASNCCFAFFARWMMQRPSRMRMTIERFIKTFSK